MVGKYHRKVTRMTNIKNHGNKARTAPVMPMAGAIFTAAILLSGLSLIGSYQQPVIAQQEGLTGTGVSMTDEGGGGATNTTTTTMGGGGGGAGATQGGGNATAANMTRGGAQGNDSMSEVRMHLEEARTALQNNDTQGALMNLDLALNALGNGNASRILSNITTGTNAIAGDTTPTIVSENPVLSASEASSANDDDEDDEDSDGSDSNTDDEDRTERDTDDEEDSECGAVNIGGTSPADDYGCPPDDDGA